MPTIDEIKQHVAKLLPGFTVEPANDGEGEICVDITQAEQPVASLNCVDGEWAVVMWAYDPGGREQPPDWYDKVIMDNQKSYWHALACAVNAIHAQDVENCISSLAGND